MNHQKTRRRTFPRGDGRRAGPSDALRRRLQSRRGTRRRRPRRHPGAGRPHVHQRGRHLHGPDGLADAARGRGGDAGRRAAVREARGPARRRRQADRRAGALRVGAGDRGLCLGALAVHGRLRRRQGPGADPPPARHDRHEERGDRPEDAPRRLRPRHPQRGGQAHRGRHAAADGSRDQRQDGDDVLPQLRRSQGQGPPRRVRRDRPVAQHPDADRRGRGYPAGGQPLAVHRSWGSTWWRSPAARACAGRSPQGSCWAART